MIRHFDKETWEKFRRKTVYALHETSASVPPSYGQTFDTNKGDSDMVLIALASKAEVSASAQTAYTEKSGSLAAQHGELYILFIQGLCNEERRRRWLW